MKYRNSWPTSKRILKRVIKLMKVLIKDVT